jgi:hypothetical protein
MLSVAVNMWIGNVAAVLCGRWGAVARRAREVGYSRTAICNHAQRVTQAVIYAQEGGSSTEALWVENTRLHSENEALWEAWVTADQLPEHKQQECAATGSAVGLSGSLAQVVAMKQALGQRLWPEWPQTCARVAAILVSVVWASSAVECVNSVVRMHQARHRHVSQRLLDLERFYWNCRAFRHGPTTMPTSDGPPHNCAWRSSSCSARRVG